MKMYIITPKYFSVLVLSGDYYFRINIKHALDVRQKNEKCRPYMKTTYKTAKVKESTITLITRCRRSFVQ